MKTCTTCGRNKPNDSYYRYHKNPDGRLNRCKKCFLRIEDRTPDALGRKRSPERTRSIPQLGVEGWRTRAACRSVNQPMWWAAPKDRNEVAWAKAVCRVCPVIRNCAQSHREQTAAHLPMVGVWAGEHWVAAGSSGTRIKIAEPHYRFHGKTAHAV